MGEKQAHEKWLLCNPFTSFSCSEQHREGKVCPMEKRTDICSDSQLCYATRSMILLTSWMKQDMSKYVLINTCRMWQPSLIGWNPMPRLASLFSLAGHTSHWYSFPRFCPFLVPPTRSQKGVPNIKYYQKVENPHHWLSWEELADVLFLLIRELIFCGVPCFPADQRRRKFPAILRPFSCWEERKWFSDPLRFSFHSRRQTCAWSISNLVTFAPWVQEEDEQRLSLLL